ncbi:MAG: FecR domain-containing protein [Gammaproteobacteria bacterium]|nr:FecR domain-containing protein [Gammaproteobacteria bacterium]
MKVLHRIILIMGMILLTAQLAWSAPLAGHVILTKGNVTATAEDGSNRALKRRSEIFNGDVIRTGPAGSVQIRFIDKALMTIKANSEMNMEAYLLAQEGNAEQKEQVLMSLVKGGFRTITGTIGKGDKSAYKVNTPAASIGIRGTNYEVQQEADGGFVMGVYSGGIQVENEAGTIDLGEGADFNFTRVKPKSPPKGLLAPPPSLGENSATEQSDEEENSEEGADDNNDEGNDDGESDSDSAENDGGDDDGGDDNNSGIFAGTDNNTGDVENEVTNAIDSKLSETIEETKDEFVDAGGADQLILDALVEAGILQIGQSLTDLDADLLALVEAWLADPTTIDALLAAIQDAFNQIANSTFDFSDPYAGITASTTSPFDTTVISGQEYGLAETGKLAVLAIPVNSSSNYVGESPNIQTLEAQLTSPDIINDANFVSYDYASNGSATINLRYTLINLTTGERNEYDIDILFDAAMATKDDVFGQISGALTENDVYRLNGVEQSGNGAPGHVTFSYNTSTGNLDFIPTTDANNFMVEMEIHVDANTASGQALLGQLGNGSSLDDFWYADAGLDMVIGNGSIDADGRPILVLKDTDTYTDENNNQVTDNRIEVVTKIPADTTTSSLLSFANCVSNNLTCDIQVDNVAAASNIRWGAWLTEPGKGIQIVEFHENDSTIETDSEEQVLAFWLAAERADINQLTGTANFSTDSDCLKFGQCIGFSDDGIVQSLSANFDVNFNTGAITNGNLTLQTSDNPSIGVLGTTPGDVASTWSVNFSGSMVNDGTMQPEFQTQTLSGTVTDSAGTHGSIIGNIGGIFVKPGDTFAGGYNLGTADGSNKHAAGVFTMDKQ